MVKNHVNAMPPKGEGGALCLSDFIPFGGFDDGLVYLEELHGIGAPFVGFDIGHPKTCGPLGGHQAGAQWRVQVSLELGLWLCCQRKRL